MKRTDCGRAIAVLAILAAVSLMAGAAGCGSLLPSQETVSTAPGPGEVIAAGELPPEAATTLGLIETGGPFPYSQDGTVFHNYEGLLPPAPDGYYREYTVVTPGSSDRGARRIIAGKGGERYYTDDHYGSFRLVVE